MRAIAGKMVGVESDENRKVNFLIEGGGTRRDNREVQWEEERREQPKWLRGAMDRPDNAIAGRWPDIQKDRAKDRCMHSMICRPCVHKGLYDAQHYVTGCYVR